MPIRQCQAAGVEQFIGQNVNHETGTAILSVTHATELRWAPPGVMLTMDYRANRVTVRLDREMKVTAINCG